VTEWKHGMKEQASEAEYNNDFKKVWFCEVMSERTPGVMPNGIAEL